MQRRTAGSMRFIAVRGMAIIPLLVVQDDGADSRPFTADLKHASEAQGMHGIEHGDISPYGRVPYHCRPMRHPAARPRLKTLFVPPSSRARRRHTAGRRWLMDLAAAAGVSSRSAAG